LFRFGRNDLVTVGHESEAAMGDRIEAELMLQ
jgi:hypothetical protein